MQKSKQRILSALTALSVATGVLCATPLSIASAADEYQVRDKWGYCTSANYVTSEHFCIFYGNNDTTGKVNDAFLQRNLADFEKLWNCYMLELDMQTPNLDMYGNSSTLYKTNVYLTYTGLDQYPDGWAFMSAEDGYGIEIISPEAMLDDLTIAHEFGHVVTMHQKAWVDQDITGAWWEAAANWFREMYLAGDYYTGSVQTCWFEPYLRNLSLTIPHGRSYYEVWPFLIYMTTNPDNLTGLGENAVMRMMSEALPGEYPFDTITRLLGTDAQTVLGHYAKRMATFDFGAQAAYQSEFKNKLASSPYYWNLFYTVLEEQANGWLAVPEEEAPMQTGLNIIPLQINGETISVSFRGASNDANAGWRAALVTVDASGNETYSDLFGDGETMSVSTAGAVSAYLTVVGTPQTLNPVNAFHKEAVSSFKTGSERRRYPYEIQLTGAAVQQSGGYSSNGVAGGAHANGGGFVASSANVAASVYVGPNAMVLGNATITGNARVEDYAVVANGVTMGDSVVVSGHAVVDGGGMIYNNGWVFGTVTLSDNAVISDSAVVTGQCKLSGNARVMQKAYVIEAVNVTENAVIKGQSYVYGSCTYSGQAILDGDYANSETLQSGASFGWLDTAGTAFTDGMISGYDFASAGSVWATDKYAATDVRLDGAVWEADRTSASGVISLDGTDDTLLLDSSVARVHNLQISLAALWKGGTAQQDLFWFGDETAYLAFTPSNANGVAEFTITDGTTTETLTAPTALTKGAWSKVTVRIVDGKGSLLINGAEVASASLQLSPIDTLSNAADDSCYVGKSLKHNSFKGAVDYVNLYFKAVDEPNVTYTGSEAVDDTDSGSVKPPVNALWGDVDVNGVVNIADVVLLARYVSQDSTLAAGTVTEQGKINADVDQNTEIGSADISNIALYLAGLITLPVNGTN